MSTISQPTPKASVSLDELIALCDEMTALSRAGVPLDRGLVQLARDLPGRLSSQAHVIGQRLESGHSLADVVASQETSLPPVYGAVVEAGLRAGNLTVALEGFSRLARHIVEIRRLVTSSLMYPMLILVIVSVLSIFVLVGTPWSPGLAEMIRASFVAQQAEPSQLGLFVVGLLETIGPWLWIIPLCLVLAAIAWWVNTRRPQAAQPSWFAAWMRWVPGAGRLLRYGRLATFADVLSLLVQQRVPLHQAIELAGNASGDLDLQKDSRNVAERLCLGETRPAAENSPAHGIPPFLRWTLMHESRHAYLEAALQRSATTYRRRTEGTAEWLRTYLPIFLTLGIGGTATVIYVMSVMLPWFALLHAIAESPRPF